MESSGPASRVFVGYRALGLVSNSVPLETRYVRQRKENFICTAVGHSLLQYGSSNLRLLSVSPPISEKISCMATNYGFHFTAAGSTIYVWRRGTELEGKLEDSDKSEIRLLLGFHRHLLSVNSNGSLKVWDVAAGLVYLEVEFKPDQFEITAMVHPETYLNKVLIGSQQGGVQLWNLKSGKLIHTFTGWNSKITVLEQSTATDVIGVGLEDGGIIIHNFKTDRTLMTFRQDWGPVTALSFRTDSEDAPLLASGSCVGHIALWDLNEKKLSSEIYEAHRSAVAGMQFLPDEALLVTNSGDNSLKMWAFDLAQGGARLLKFREGFAEPPTCAKFYDELGKTILSASADGTIRSFSTVNDMLHKSLGRASWHAKQAKKQGAKHDAHFRMNPVKKFAVETIREEDWDNLVAIHKCEKVATTWNVGKSKMGSHKLIHPRFDKDASLTNMEASAVAMSACGNFAFVGYSSGHIDKFNVQSGLHRGSVGKDSEPAHSGYVAGVACDGLGQRVISAGVDGIVRFWRFRDLKPLGETNVGSGVTLLEVCRTSGLVAAALGNLSIAVLDIETRKIARLFDESRNSMQISAMTFSPDGRWLVVASKEGYKINMWDIVTGHLLDSFLVPSPCIALTFSPTSEFLATCHEGELGVFLWVNSTLFSAIALRPLKEGVVPGKMMLPGNAPLHDGENENVEVDSDSEEFPVSENIFDSVGEVGGIETQEEALVSLSQLPAARWKNLLQLDVIKERNKPTEPVSQPKAAPFFLPTVPGLDFQFDLSSDTAADEGSKLVNSKIFELTEWGKLLEDAKLSGDFETVFARLKEFGPSKIDSEIMSLGSDSKESGDLLLTFLQMIHCVLESRLDFELAQAYLALFLKRHWSTVVEKQSVLRYLTEEIGPLVETTWSRVEVLLNQNTCLVNFLQSVVL